MENGSIIPIEPDCDEEPSPICEREAEVVLGTVDKWTCCSKEICGMYAGWSLTVSYTTRYVDIICEKKHSMHNVW